MMSNIHNDILWESLVETLEEKGYSYAEACEKAKEMLDDNEPFPSHEEQREEEDENRR